MSRVAVVIGCESGAAKLPVSDRAALTLALSRYGAEVRVYARDPDAGAWARAAGARTVEAAPTPALEAFDVARYEVARYDVASFDVASFDVTSFDVILVGRGGCGEDGDLLPARLAETRGAALACDVLDLETASDGLRATRDLGRGARDVVQARGPVVLVLAESASPGPYVSAHRLDVARRAHPEAPARRDVAAPEWQASIPRVRLGDHTSRVAGGASRRMDALFGLGGGRESAPSLVAGSGEECARELLRYLRHHGFAPGGGAGADAEPVATAERRERVAGGEPSEPAPSLPAGFRRRPRRLRDSTAPARGPFRIAGDTAEARGAGGSRGARHGHEGRIQP